MASNNTSYVQPVVGKTSKLISLITNKQTFDEDYSDLDLTSVGNPTTGRSYQFHRTFLPHKYQYPFGLSWYVPMWEEHLFPRYSSSYISPTGGWYHWMSSFGQTMNPIPSYNLYTSIGNYKQTDLFIDRIKRYTNGKLFQNDCIGDTLYLWVDSNGSNKRFDSRVWGNKYTSSWFSYSKDIENYSTGKIKPLSKNRISKIFSLYEGVKYKLEVACKKDISSGDGILIKWGTPINWNTTEQSEWQTINTTTKGSLRISVSDCTAITNRFEGFDDNENTVLGSSYGSFFANIPTNSYINSKGYPSLGIQDINSSTVKFPVIVSWNRDFTSFPEEIYNVDYNAAAATTLWYYRKWGMYKLCSEMIPGKGYFNNSVLPDIVTTKYFEVDIRIKDIISAPNQTAVFYFTLPFESANIGSSSIRLSGDVYTNNQTKWNEMWRNIASEEFYSKQERFQYIPEFDVAFDPKDKHIETYTKDHRIQIQTPTGRTVHKQFRNCILTISEEQFVSDPYNGIDNELINYPCADNACERISETLKSNLVFPLTCNYLTEEPSKLRHFFPKGLYNYSVSLSDINSFTDPSLYKLDTFKSINQYAVCGISNYEFKTKQIVLQEPKPDIIAALSIDSIDYGPNGYKTAKHLDDFVSSCPTFRFISDTVPKEVKKLLMLT
jgi:hypothetical protein